LYKHSDYEHHLYHDDRDGSDGYRSSWGCDGELVSECGDDLRIANCFGDLHLHGDDDRGLYGWDEHDHWHNNSNTEQYSGSAVEHTDPVYQHGSYQHYDCDHGCNRHRNCNRLTGGCYGGVVFEHDYDQRNTDGLRDL
jgi:hypothetical protein